MRTDVELMDSLARLPREHQEVVSLFYLLGYDYEEVSKMAGIPTSTVRSRLYEARKKLKMMWFDSKDATDTPKNC